MAYYLPQNPPDSISEIEGVPDSVSLETPLSDNMSDLRVFWGPEICRVEYLLHLVDTGRIKDRYGHSSESA